MDSVHFKREVQTFDLDEANALTDELFRSKRWIAQDEDGNDVPDTAKAKAQLVTTFRDFHTVSESTVAKLRTPININKELETKGVTVDELYIELFGGGAPGATGDEDELTPEEQAVSALLKKLVWGWAGYSRTSHVQKEVKPLGYLLVEAKVGDPKEMRRFLTDSFDLVKTYLVKAKVLTSNERNAKATEAWLEEMTSRLPKEMALPLSRYARAEIQKNLALIKHADPAWITATIMPGDQQELGA
jgi:hypothetical protein